MATKALCLRKSAPVVACQYRNFDDSCLHSPSMPEPTRPLPPLLPLPNGSWQGVSVTTSVNFKIRGAGYNWLRSADEASERLERLINEIIDYRKAHRRKCEQVILVMHSMDGLVARAWAKRIPDRIAGVIHGVMPALGAPAAYRRMACGTEVNDFVGRFAAMVLGVITYQTAPVLATAPGPLELLPNHMYPGRWLQVSVKQISGIKRCSRYSS